VKRFACRVDETAMAEGVWAAISQLGLSARAFHRSLKLARTIADLTGSEAIQPALRRGGGNSV
jgi:magnesium chelatase family protein